jgi:carbonic anhydrase
MTDPETAGPDGINTVDQTRMAGAAARRVEMPSPVDRLISGNSRFLAAIASASDPEAAVAGLKFADPYSIVLGCSDSRVPPEIVFDEPPGRLFVVRVASNVAGSAEIGSIEYALSRWECPLLVVLGHTECGGIAAAMDPLPPGADPPPDARGAVHLGSLLSSIKTNLGRSPECFSDDPWRDAVCLNVRRTVELLQNWSEPIHRRVAAGRLIVVGAIYDVATGAVGILTD